MPGLPEPARAPPALAELEAIFGGLDVYLFDLLLKGGIEAGMRVLDAGCGAGRNVAYLLTQPLEVHGVDHDPGAIAAARRLAAERAPSAPAERFRVGELTRLPYPDGSFDVVLSIAVLHFASGKTDFEGMLAELWRVLAPGGRLFARLASRTGIEDRVRGLGDGRYRLPDGSDRYLVDEAFLVDRAGALGGRLLEPVRTVNVQGLRCMATWVVAKPATPASR